MPVMKLLSVAGARPNFIKIASIAKAVDRHNQNCRSAGGGEEIEHIIVHTGQHYDARMSHLFFTELGIPAPKINLDVGSGSHAAQTAEIMKRFEPVLLQERPDVLLVVGDVNSTIGCSLVAAKIQYSPPSPFLRPLIVHVEAGLRSFDRAMPEEINRLLTDVLSDLLFVTEESGLHNLEREGIAAEKIRFAGNVMIDTLLQYLETARKSTVQQVLGLSGPYALVTLHRPANVDEYEMLEELVQCFLDIAKRLQLVFPVHPRTAKSLRQFGLWEKLQGAKNIFLSEPLGYLDFLNLLGDATVVLTDSGGIQEETTALGVPCLTLRENTERPVTVTVGSNYLIGMDPAKILAAIDAILAGQGKKAAIPELWDGKASDRIIAALVQSWKQRV